MAVIGITTYGGNDAAQPEFTLPRDYVDSVRRAGGIPLLISPGENRLADLVSKLDGLILAGGGDLDPNLYGGTQHESIYMVDTERDQSEVELARAAIDSGMPILGICRGIQLINIVLGGTLHEHLPDVVGDSVTHRLPPREPTEHDVAIKPETRLAEILGALEFRAASWHHQAIRDVAEGFVVAAHAADGTIEAIEMPDHDWLFAVQWHPELTAVDCPVQQRLFAELVRVAGEFRRETV
ncbi:MAG: gamma-glutamyl-gamma-aminobutyrate hydrolase family protein [Planctomycetaceae bacterium]|jgi:putative glutamine amidotransferase|nr:gamma-glutamyl-gamma-aminobutyrate hydrolase family protein [Planctomycetaceae bacterium]MBT6158020.1 gamma-glutamyl-gamma-aminobutyrate hydrolase family protein [Planctomycetaceae bacterium]MBT6484769.1 gamma-glutamyl-gamma-aminobutyrate hydrolase family protein [Planctomycetaceae bacterium]MBT6494134.1 gamma-glutamyl-gamma-aminobutyrate hydrolase family protein [Planctomycetaceae bacterium]